MNHFNPQANIVARVLASDLDGTFIPLPENSENAAALETLSKQHAAHRFRLIFVTGRHFNSVLNAISEHQLPTPEWIVCDVGSSIYKRGGSLFTHYRPYEDFLSKLTGDVNRNEVESLLSGIDGLQLQASENQQRFKISYHCTPAALEQLVPAIRERLTAREFPYNCIESIDPFSNSGLIDVLPTGLSKAYALLWLAAHADFKPDEVIFSGDSGNDYAALVSGFRAILVGNASAALKAKVKRAMAERGLSERLYTARADATSGVLEGCRAFGLFGA